MKPSPNKTVTCCLCSSKRDVLTAQPDGACRIFCPKCGRHTTHHRDPIAQRQPDTAKTLAASVSHLTAKMRPNIGGSRASSLPCRCNENGSSNCVT
jgi:predicted amidophosphoribosyltransferase